MIQLDDEFHRFLSANAHRKINMGPENHPFGKEKHLQNLNLHFWGPCYVCGGVFEFGGCNVFSE